MGRQLQDTAGNSTPPAQLATVDSDFVVILASLLCALICVLGLLAVARCAWLRRLSSSRSTAPIPATAAPNKGLKKKVLKALPRETFSDKVSVKFSECAICLTEFAAGEEIRVLPNCGHSFHVSCIDTWLGSHSSCPSCRQVLVVARCHKCGGLPPHPTASGDGSVSFASSSEVRLKEREDDRANSFLP